MTIYFLLYILYFFSTFSYDVIFLGGLSAIVERFLDTGARVLFSAEAYCWPDKSLAAHYPPVSRGKRYLNSGGFIGYASDVYKILDTALIKDEDDDQLFYTTVYLHEDLRLRHKIKLDHKSEIFQNLYGAVGKGKRNLRREASMFSTLIAIVVLYSRCGAQVQGGRSLSPEHRLQHGAPGTSR